MAVEFMKRFIQKVDRWGECDKDTGVEHVHRVSPLCV